MDVDGIQTPSKRCRTASGSAPTRATIARMTRLQKTRADALTNAMVVDLIYQVRDATLTAATYGRSMWRLQIK